MVNTCLPWTVNSGEWQMQQDLALVESVSSDPDPGIVLRFYGWEEDTLSLGYHQKLAVYPEIPCVRRPTGGRAVLHQAADREADLTYSLIFPLQLLPQGIRSRQDSYIFLSQFLILGLKRLGIPISFGSRQERLIQANSCFVCQTPADLICQNHKVIGSAQLWKPKVILQQGTLLLNPDVQVWNSVLPGSGDSLRGLFSILQQPLSRSTLVNSFHEAAQEAFSGTWQILGEGDISGSQYNT
jgi:lipoate-protein ligase A